MERGDRGQLFVLAALALAVMIVGVALLLNSSAYGANLAAQNSESGVEEPREFLREAELGANRVMEHSNYNNFTNYDELRRNFRVGVHNWSDRAHHHRALSGDGVEIREVNTTNGSRITQDTDDRQFLNSGRTANWSLGTGLDGVRQFRMNVTTTSLRHDPDVDTSSEYLSSNYFRVIVETEGGPTRRVYVHTNSAGDRALVRVDGPSGLSPSCSARGNQNDRVTLHLSNGLVGRDHCEQLAFLDDPRTPFAINYTNGDAIEGSYELFVNERFSNVSDGDFSGTHPTLERAIYSGTIAVNYTDEGAQLRGNRTATPDRRRPIDAGSPFSFSIAVGDWVTFRDGGRLTVLNKSGFVDDTTPSGNPRGIGPTAVSVNGDDIDDTPYSSSNSGLLTFPRDGSGNQRLARNATSNWTTLGVGTWNKSGPSVFYPGGSGTGGVTSADLEIRLVNGTQTNSDNGLVFTDGNNDTAAVAGPANMTPDPANELVYLDGGGNILYADNGSAYQAVPVSDITGYSNAPAIGTPADYNDNGTARVPYVNTADEITLATKDGATETIPLPMGEAPVSAPMATLDWDADGELDIIYINQSEQGLRVIYNVTGTNTVRSVNDSSGDEITGVDTELGVR